MIFNAIIIPFLVPLSLQGVKYRAIGATALLRRNLLIYGLGGIILPFVGIKLIDLIIHNLLGAVASAHGTGALPDPARDGRRRRQDLPHAARGPPGPARGLDVVIGYLEPHERPETRALAAGLEQVPHLRNRTPAWSSRRWTSMLLQRLPRSSRWSTSSPTPMPLRRGT